MLKFGGTSGNLKEIKTWLKGDIDYGEVSNRENNEGKLNVCVLRVLGAIAPLGFAPLRKLGKQNWTITH